MIAHPTLAALRQEAIKIVSQNTPQETASPADLDAVSLLHELHVHQVALELQMQAMKEALVEAEASRAKFYDLFQFAPVGCFSLSAGGKILEINRKGLAMLGLKTGDAVGQQIRDFFDLRSLDHLGLLLTTAQNTDSDVLIPKPLLLKGHRKLPILVSGQARSSADHATQKICIRLALIDVSLEQVAKQDALRALEQVSGYGALT